jgi:hypothetical protein
LTGFCADLVFTAGVFASTWVLLNWLASPTSRDWVWNWVAWTSSVAFALVLTAVQQDSLLLRFGENVAWELMKYVSGAAALGSLWHHLPGVRGPVKGAAVGFAYFVVGGLTYVVPALAGGGTDVGELIDAGTFTLGMLVGLLMDREVLLSYDLETEGRWQGFVVRYGWRTRPLGSRCSSRRSRRYWLA